LIDEDFKKANLMKEADGIFPPDRFFEKIISGTLINE
jgi:hypothetical protein